jgi:hypothetical protein
MLLPNNSDAEATKRESVEVVGVSLLFDGGVWSVHVCEVETGGPISAVRSGVFQISAARSRVFLICAARSSAVNT